VPTQFNLLHGMTVARNGDVFVADRNANRVQAFTKDGKFLGESFVAKNTPQHDYGTAFGVALSGDKDQRFLYVADGHNEVVHVLDRKTLAEIPGAAFGRVGLYAGQFSNIHVIASDSKGNVYVGDGGGRFQKFVYKGMAQ
jgi:DNA-binding beta-propeller fold protein YncE